MVSINPPLSSSTQRAKFPQALMEGLSRKRKFDDDDEAYENGEILEKSLFKSLKSMPSTDFHLDSPLPLEWQRCLDIKSGQIYFYNTRTHKRISTDPRLNQEPTTNHVISLDLELNLPCSSSPLKKNVNFTNNIDLNRANTTARWTPDPTKNNAGTIEMSSSPSWLASSEGGDQHQEEMVAAVCNKCHMLVIMCKISPSCPNCKFMHESSTTNLFKRRSLSLLC